MVGGSGVRPQYLSVANSILDVDAMTGTEVVQRNPARLVGRRHRFGDLLGAMIVAELAARRGIDLVRGPTRRLLGAGSILELARAGDVVWGSGSTGVPAPCDSGFSAVDVRAVRGPLSAAWLQDQGAVVPPVFGDPALLVAELWPANPREMCKRWDYTIVPNRYDARAFRRNAHAAMPQWPFVDIRRRILGSQLVVTSSLTGLVVAEAYGIPTRLIRHDGESIFRFEDYYRGTGRERFEPAGDVRDAVRMGGETPSQWTATALLEAFPASVC